ncbi:MAG: hypothetical protein AAGG01_00570 [Planctomycetota bacterium]
MRLSPRMGIQLVPLAFLALAPLASSQTLRYALDGLDDDEFFASEVATIGDYNGDGREDYAVLVSGRYFDLEQSSGQQGISVIEIRSGRSGNLLRTLENPFAPLLRVFLDMAVIPDADGDGLSDLAVTWVFGFFDEVGAIRLSSATGAVIDEILPPSGRVISPYGIRPLHDVDGDGTRDFAVPLGVIFTGTSDGNAVAIYSGETNAPLRLLEPAGRHFSYGWDVLSIPDIDGDGALDIAVSASGDDRIGVRAGAVYFHSGATGAVIDVLYGSTAEERFGFALAVLPDLDTDGIQDLAISSTFLLDIDATCFVTLYSGATRAPLRTITSTDVGDTFGWDVTVVGDQDADGSVDLAIGAPEFRASPAQVGRVEIHSLVDSRMLGDVISDREGGAFGNVIVRLDDVRPNGFDEILMAGNGNVSFGGSRIGRIAVYDGPIGGDCVDSVPFCGQTVPNSVGALATLTQIGDANLPGSNFRLFGNDLPVGSTALLLTSLDTGFVANPGGSFGNLCLGGAVGRFQSIIGQVGPSGRIVFRPDLSQMPTPTGFVAATPVDVWHFQAWYRDVDASGAAGSHFTSALSVDVCP